MKTKCFADTETEPLTAFHEVGRVAAFLDMSVRFIKDQIKAGHLDGYRMGNKIVVSDPSLREYLRNRRIGTSRAIDEPEAA